ncbi:DEAD/DEAH box helicase [Flavobacterium sp.]|uniref:DEAD/DEAH box helicase n=1 Tax=Flavobacterium sp. TaxID=239 RepID=UPI00262BDA9B|nr:DEAD/DEAH box helicase [Flavobacterium sp.]
MEVKDILIRLLNIELVANANRLKLINRISTEQIDEDFLTDIISNLNELSVRTDEHSKKQLIAICALLWTYRKIEWDGLKNYLILFLSRAGFGPSSIMIDSNYSFTDKQFSFSENLMNQFAVTVAQVKNEIKVGNSIFLLSDFQKDIWESIEKNSLIGISAPTSAGKSFLILLKAIDLIQKKRGVVIYVVPTLSLVSQVTSDFRKLLDDFQLSDYSLDSTYNNTAATEKSIYILTQEKAIAAFSQSDSPFKNVRLLVVDEIQNVEKVADSDDQRSKVLYDLMIELRNSSTIDHIILSGPRIVKIDELGTNVFGINSEKKETDASPVLNLTYSISKKKNDYYFNVYSDLLENSQQIKITNDDVIQGYGKVQYNDNYLDYLSSFLKGFGDDESTLIFSPTSNTCNKMASHIAENMVERNNTYLSELSDFISETVHPKFTIVETILKGVAYHHGKLPFHVRVLIEDGIKQKNIKTIVCTTTLLQGVNLPVQNIIIRNPNLFIARTENSSKLSNYEIANLRGRAGRLLKDFIGRTFILDELSFKEKEANQLELFKDTAKELQVGYGKKYNAHKDKIKTDITNNVGSTIKNQEYSFLTTYLRQTVLRYGLLSQVYLGRVGIVLSDSEMNNIFEAMNKLSIGKAICSKNRYWDPIDLNNLYLKRNNFSLPTSASEQNISYKLKAILGLIKRDFPIYYNKYFGVADYPGKDILLQKSILAENWLKEKSLAEIFSDSYYDSSEKIDDTISFLQNKISYGLPLLLKPLYDIKEPDGMFTRFIELGAYKPITRKLIELNIPRETAIYLTDKYEFNNIDNKQELINQLRAIRNELSYWYKIQLSTI